MRTKAAERPERIAARLDAAVENADPLSKQLSTSIISLSALMEAQHGDTYKELDVNRGLTTAITSLRLAGAPYELRHRDLTERILLTTGGVTNLCRKLISLQLIEKDEDEDDGRGVIYRLTEKGVDLSTQLINRIHSTEKHIFKSLDEDEKSQLAALIKKVLIQLD